MIPLFIFFVNRPLSLLTYLIGILFIALISLLEWPHGLLIGLTFVFLWLAFTIWYPVFLFDYYILNGGEDLKIRQVSLGSFRKTLNKVYILNIVAIGIAAFLGTYFFPHVSISALFLFVYCLITYKILEQIVIAKFASEGIKLNLDLKDLDLNGIYADVREILTKKLIS